MSLDGQSSSQAENSQGEIPSRLSLLSRVICAHCWSQYPPENTLWISSERDSERGDTKLGPDAPRRFAAERFDVQGNALDASGKDGGRAQGLACPNCHLEVPRVLYEYKPFFVSIIGAPSSGKSFFLPAMTWYLRSNMPEKFAVNFQDADPRLNIRLHDYEETLFLNPDRDSVVTIAKTTEKEAENLYDQVLMGKERVMFPRPFVFRVEPTAAHPVASRIAAISRAVCMYDNAGESFGAAATVESSRLTNHLEHCDLTLFLFDPTQHPRFREAAKDKSNDPQWTRQLKKVVLQNTILDNAAARLRKLRGMSLQERFGGPLVVVVTKLDAWVKLLPAENRNQLLAAEYLPQITAGSSMSVIRSDLVQVLSQTVRGLLRTLAPEIVSAAEGYSTDVTYIPVSATGSGVQPIAGASQSADGNISLGVRPRNMQPKWCELPLLVGLSKAKTQLVRAAASASAPIPAAGHGKDSAVHPT